MTYKLLTGLGLLLGLAGCGTGDDRPTVIEQVDTFDVGGMLENLADNIIIPHYQEFADSSAILKDSLVSYCQAIDTSTEASALAQTQIDWRDSMQQWQLSELFILGPVATNSQHLRNQIYSFGTQNNSLCGLDQAVIQQATVGLDLDTRPASVKGLNALDYLLFTTDLNHSCPSQVTETSDWNTRTAVQRKQWRCDYAALLADDINKQANTVVNAWSPQDDDYRATFLAPANTQATLNEVSDALFFVDKELKDLKLGGPLGRVGCAPVDCSARTDTESPYSRNALNNLQANLNGFKAMFTGDAGSSFDDLIVDAGEADLAEDFVALIDATQAQISALNTDLHNLTTAVNSAQAIAECEQAIGEPSQASNYPICNVYGNIKTLSDKLKTEFILATALTIPARAQSDND